ncbi:MAG: hypothetical protein ACK5LJ_02665 [Paracoccus sp. (in: a-proteobacteria)]
MRASVSTMALIGLMSLSLPAFAQDQWTCLGKVPVSLLFHAAFFSKATGLFPARAECRRLGL